MMSMSTIRRMTLFLGGAYLLCYGLRLERPIALSAARKTLFCLYHISLIGFAALFSFAATHKDGREWTGVAIVSAALLFAIIAPLLFYLPWFMPTYETQTFYGWDVTTANLVNSIFKIALLIGGSLLMFLPRHWRWCKVKTLARWRGEVSE